MAEAMPFQSSPSTDLIRGYLEFFLRPLQTLRPEQPPIHSMQPLRLGARDQPIMRNRQQILRHKPYRLLRTHPVQRIEALHLDGPREGPQRPLPAQIEIK